MKTKAAVAWQAGQPLTIEGDARADVNDDAGAFVAQDGREDAFGVGARHRVVHMEGKINIDDLITHTMPLEDINKGFELMKSGESIRGVVIY